MSFSVDQFMQVKCKLQLASESESSESIHTNCEQVRLCACAELDKNSTLIVLVCSNETSNNHILAYYTERRQAYESANSPNGAHEDNIQARIGSEGLTFSRLAKQDAHLSQLTSSLLAPRSRRSQPSRRAKTVVKQIYYHNYNEDIVALCLSEGANKLILISASSTIYILPIKNVILNLHAQQLRSSQGKSMYFYDATTIGSLKSINDPVAIVCWESAVEPEKGYIIVACADGNRLVFIDAAQKKELCSTSVSEPIRSIEIVRDRFSYSLLITCTSCNQYRQTLELLTQDHKQQQTGSGSRAPASLKPSIIQLPKSGAKVSRHLGSIDDETMLTERDFTPSWTSKPLPIRLNTGNGNAATSAINRVFTPASRFGGQTTSLSSASLLADSRDRPISVLMKQAPNLFAIVDVLGANQEAKKSARPATSPQLGQKTATEARLLRFYSNRQFFYRPQRPQVVCKLNGLDANELITHMVLTERFIAFATDRDRCVINSRNCCKLKQPTPQAPIELDPLVKEVTFNNEERILALIKAPIIYDQDNILDSFTLVTTRSIYSIDARHNCRDLFINLIDSHLAIKRTLFTPRTPLRLFDGGGCGGGCGNDDDDDYDQDYQDRLTLLASNGQRNTAEPAPSDAHRSRSAESNLLINDFLQHREIYERICHDSLAFSTLFKLELASLYEAYADRLLQRQQFELANRFFLLAAFDHSKTLGKYVRIGAYKETVDYVKSLLSDENDFRKILDENERLELAKIAFECLLARLIVERSKILVYRTKLKRSRFDTILTSKLLSVRCGNKESCPLGALKKLETNSNPTRLDMLKLCEHSPRGQDAKLSTTTIVGDLQADEEETLTSNTDGDDDSSQRGLAARRLLRDQGAKCRPECEKNLIEFMLHLMPGSLYDYAVDRLLDFDLIDLVEPIAQTDAQILSLVKALIRNREEERLLFRTGNKFEQKLAHLKKTQLIRINTRKLEFLEFMTSPKVTRALVKDISLTCDFYGYQHTLVQFRKYSFAALRHLDTYKLVVGDRHREKERHQRGRESSSGSGGGGGSISANNDDDANDGVSFASRRANSTRRLFNEQQRQAVEEIFLQFLTACLEESSEDCCRLWFNYINFYLNYMGTLQALETDILKMVESSGDCRLAVSLYKAIYREETAKVKGPKNGSIKDAGTRLAGFKRANVSVKDTSSFLKANLIANTPLESMNELHNLEALFANEFLMRLLDKTLDLLPKSSDLDALTIATMC